MRAISHLSLRLFAILACTLAWETACSEAAAAPGKKADEAAPCEAHYEALLGGKAPAKVSPAAAEIAKLIEKRFAGADFTWVEGKKRGARLEKFFQQLLTLKNEEKTGLLKALREAYPNLEEAPLLARIGLNDESGWQKFFRESSTEPTLQPLMIGELRPLVEAMPETTRRKILGEIGERYPTAGKVPEGTKGDGRFWPKRLLDGWLRVLLKGDDTFRAGIAKGKGPLAAYQDYLDDVKQLVFKRANPKQRYAELSAQDLLKIAREIQAFLKLPSTKEQLYKGIWDDNRRLLPPVVRLYGSTVKGTSRLGSDLDMGYFNLDNYANFGFIAGGERRGVQVPGLAPRLEALAEKLHPGIALNAHGNAHTLHLVDNSLTALEPFMIEVTPDSVELLVYPRQIAANKLDPKGPAIYQAPAPTRYRLD